MEIEALRVTVKIKDWDFTHNEGGYMLFGNIVHDAEKRDKNLHGIDFMRENRLSGKCFYYHEEYGAMSRQTFYCEGIIIHE